ncbi:hypothetical protein [Flavobacterium sp. LAR06]|uniref:hypothetical protein n=1 Tax=Flavobacterium sp. LAR06 TaxID=3064897 RepID=UPI0035C03809
MKKSRFLVRDKKNIFIKMFKRKFNVQFEFIADHTFGDDHNKQQNFDGYIIAVYSKNELLKLLGSTKEKQALIICLFNTEISTDMIFLEEIDNVLLLDSFKTKAEIIKDLQTHLHNRCNSAQQKDILARASPIYKYDFNNILKGLIFLNQY